MHDAPAPPESTPSEVAGGGTRAVRTRFAPSPNGPLHVDPARTAVFNWMLARQHAGRYFVRFERTDHPREAAGARASMMEDLDDPVLVRSSGAPTFFLASTADDIQDRVSDLIRPDVLLRASAKQLHIWAALGHRLPRIGHHPLMKPPGGQNVTAAGGQVSVRRLRETGINRAAIR